MTNKKIAELEMVIALYDKRIYNLEIKHEAAIRSGNKKESSLLMHEMVEFQCIRQKYVKLKDQLILENIRKELSEM